MPPKAGPKGSRTKTALAQMMAPEPSVADLVDEMKADYQVKLAELILASNVQQAAISVTAEGDARAELLGEQLEELFWSKLPAMLQSFAYGRVAFEKEWSYAAPGQMNFVKNLCELPYRHTEMILDSEGSFAGVKLIPKDKKQSPIVLTPDYSWWLAIDDTPLEPHGKSQFTGAAEKVYNDRKESLRLLRLFMKKFVLGSGIIHGPQTYPAMDETSQPLDGEETCREAYAAYEAGGLFWADNNRLKDLDGKDAGVYETDLSQVKFEVRDGRPILDVIEKMDGWQLLAFGFPPKTVLEGDAVGSFAMVSQQMLILLAVVERFLTQIVTSYQKYVIDKVVEKNWTGQKPSILIDFTSMTERPDALASELVKAWLTTPQLSPLIMSGAVDVLAVLEAVGVAVSPEAGQRLQAMFAKLAMQPQQPQQLPAPNADPVTQLASPFLRSIWDTVDLST